MPDPATPTKAVEILLDGHKLFTHRAADDQIVLDAVTDTTPLYRMRFWLSAADVDSVIALLTAAAIDERPARLEAIGDAGAPTDRHHCPRHLPSKKAIHQSRRRRHRRRGGLTLTDGTAVRCPCGKRYELRTQWAETSYVWQTTEHPRTWYRANACSAPIPTEPTQRGDR